MPDRKKDPYRVYNFYLEVDGITRAGFRECSGLDTAQDPIEYREGEDEMTVRKMPGLNKYSNISLKWGSSDDTELWAWRDDFGAESVWAMRLGEATIEAGSQALWPALTAL